MSSISKYLPKELTNDLIKRLEWEEVKDLVSGLRGLRGTDLDNFELPEKVRKIWDRFISLVLLSLPVSVIGTEAKVPVYTPFSVISGMFIGFSGIYGKEEWPRGFVNFLITANEDELRLIVQILNMIPDLEEASKGLEQLDNYSGLVSKVPINPILN